MIFPSSAHPRESEDPVLWASGHGLWRAKANPTHSASRQHWIPAFAGMSGRMVVLWLTVLSLLASPAFGAEPAAAPDRPLPDAAQEARAQTLFKDVRCVVCQHESIADSPAGIAGDMRQRIREEIASGDTDAAVREDLVKLYGDYILFTPPVREGTWLLWFGPLVLVLLGAAALIAFSRRKPVESTPLSPDEERRLADLLQSETVRPDPAASAPHDGR